MNPPQLVINVSGGLVQEVFAADPNLDVLLVDWDVEGADVDHPDVVSVRNRHGRTHLAYVAPVLVHSLSSLANTDVAAALAAARTSQCVV